MWIEMLSHLFLDSSINHVNWNASIWKKKKKKKKLGRRCTLQNGSPTARTPCAFSKYDLKFNLVSTCYNVRLRVLVPGELVCGLADLRHAELLGPHVLLELIKFPLENLENNNQDDFSYEAIFYIVEFPSPPFLTQP